jgi:hypothetical protein
MTPENLLRLGMGFWGSKAFLSAVELGVFTELAKGETDLESLSRRIGLHHRGARDFLDALVALEVLDRSDGKYRNTPKTDMFLDRGKPSYIGGLFEMANARLYPFWGSLTEALRTGQQQNEAKGSSGVVRSPLFRSGEASRLPFGDERRQRRRGPRYGRKVRLEGLCELRGCGHGARNRPRHACTRPCPPVRHRLRSIAGQAHFR